MSIPKTELKEPKDNSWISRNSFSLMSKKANARREHNSELANSLSKQLKNSLRADRRRRIFNTSIEIEHDLRTGDVIGAYGRLRAWYKFFSGRPEKPAKVDMEKHTSIYGYL